MEVISPKHLCQSRIWFSPYIFVVTSGGCWMLEKNIKNADHVQKEFWLNCNILLCFIVSCWFTFDVYQLRFCLLMDVIAVDRKNPRRSENLEIRVPFGAFLFILFHLFVDALTGSQGLKKWNSFPFHFSFNLKSIFKFIFLAAVFWILKFSLRP